MASGEASLGLAISFSNIPQLRHPQACSSSKPCTSYQAVPGLTGASWMSAACSSLGSCYRSSCSGASTAGSWEQLTNYLGRSLNSDDFVISLAT